MVNTAEKVTAFVTQQTDAGYNLLLIEHPYAGIQIPAGTVEPTESPDQAVLREVLEETGLMVSSSPLFLGYRETQLTADEGVILPPCPVYARPDTSSFDWICIRSSVQVKVLHKLEGFKQINYIEHDQIPDPNYVSMEITGWVPDERVANTLKRHFYCLKFEGTTEPSWKVFSDHHTFTVFWAALHDLPTIIPPQNTWLEFLFDNFDEKI
jgi:8-oxo-dGTP pyrophosphatase MutT (NUDIX family)